MLIPAIIGLIVWKFGLLDKIILLLLTLLKQDFGVNLGLLYFVSYLSVLLRGGVSIITAFAISGIVFFIFSRILRFRFNIFEFIVYYAVYFPIIMLFYIYSGIATLFHRELHFDWKV
jgi:hypothetical protein